MHEDVDLGERLGSMRTSKPVKCKFIIFTLVGAYGEVCSGILRRDEDEIKVAVKTLKREVGKQERVELVNEAKTICQFDHQNIVKVFGIAPLEGALLLYQYLYKRYHDFLFYILTLKCVRMTKCTENTSEPMLMVMEFVPGGNLSSRLSKY